MMTAMLVAALALWAIIFILMWRFAVCEFKPRRNFGLSPIRRDDDDDI